MVIGATFTDYLYELNLLFYKRFGWFGLAETWKNRKTWWLPTSRGICIGIAVVTFLLSLFIVKEI